MYHYKELFIVIFKASRTTPGLQLLTKIPAELITLWGSNSGRRKDLYSNSGLEH